MNILIISYGSRGDVQPYIALGMGLQNAGHTVTLATSSRFKNFVESHGLDYGYMSDDLLSIIDTDQGKELLESTSNIFDVIKQNIKLSKQLKPLQTAQFLETWALSKKINPDCIVYHPKAGAAPHIAEKLAIPCILGTPIPMFVPTSERPFLVLPPWKLGGWYNRLSYKIIASLTKLALGSYVRDFRSHIGLAPLKPFNLLRTGDGHDIPVLHAYSEAVLSRPTDWPETAFVTGYWFMDNDTDWSPPTDLLDFLAAGGPPVYIGFGSMAGRAPAQLAELVIEALKIAGVRGIIATGWGGLTAEDLPESIFKIESAPHDWLFPKVAAVVHHGGAGTTGAGLRAGKPSVVIPFFGDQPFWARTVYALGAGPKPIPKKKLTAEKLAAAISEAVTNIDIQRNAKAIGEKITQEDGVVTAVTTIERIMRKD
jgi:sterol 3beta-glucosyltransferase